MQGSPGHRTGTRTGAGRPARNRYRRGRDLPRLLPLLETELVTDTPAQHLRLIGLIRRALRRERTRGAGGHWSYDLARHAGLLAAYTAEQAALADRLAASGSDHSNSV